MKPNNNAFYRGHLQDLDGIRGLLAVAVMLYHFGLNTILNRLSGGIFEDVKWGLCVDFFFILSGFVLANSFAKKPLSPTSYIVKRTFRLLPVHVAILAGFLAALITAYNPSLVDILINFTLLQSTIGMDSLNGPSWSAGLEYTLPLIAVLIWPQYLRLQGLTASLVFIAFLAASAWVTYVFAMGERIDILRALFGLGVGFMLFSIAKGHIDPVRSPKRSSWTYAAFICTIAVIFAVDLWAPAALLFPVFSALTILAGARSRSLLSSALIQWLGARSYTIYMVHFPVLVAATAFLGADRLDGSVPIKVGMIATSLLLADFLTRFIERPFMNRRQDRKGRDNADYDGGVARSRGNHGSDDQCGDDAQLRTD